MERIRLGLSDSGKGFVIGCFQCDNELLDLKESLWLIEHVLTSVRLGCFMQLTFCFSVTVKARHLHLMDQLLQNLIQ
jgi:hypothetical protein